tara:strand:- start:1187 stop:1591 length:405 start_codon:yes stop_codon:yes gene_type:complete
MGINSQGVAYNFGQLGSGHIKATNVELFAPTGKVIVAITMLEAMKFTKLIADDSYIANGSATIDDGVSFIGTGAQFLANGEDDDGDTVTSVPIANTVEFPAGLTIYGRWTSLQLVDLAGGDDTNTHGVIVYYGH